MIANIEFAGFGRERGKERGEREREGGRGEEGRESGRDNAGEPPFYMGKTETTGTIIVAA